MWLVCDFVNTLCRVEEERGVTPVEMEVNRIAVRLSVLELMTLSISAALSSDHRAVTAPGAAAAAACQPL